MPAPPPATDSFPLRARTGERYLVDSADQPFLIHGDTAWSIAAQLTAADIELYLSDRHARGVNTILFSAPEAYYSNQRPAYRNVDGLEPFAQMARFSRPVEGYWKRVDQIVNGAYSRGMLCIINPAYLGAVGDGWLDAIETASPDELVAYGAFLARRYTQGNVIWCLGGDRDGTHALLMKQWNIVTGIRSVRTTDLITAHPLSDPNDSDDAFTYWHGYEGFSCNAIYGCEPTGAYVYEMAAQAYARPGPMPFIGFEFSYENERNATPATLRRQSYGALLSGACGQIFGNSPVWHFGSRRAPWPVRADWRTELNSVGAVEQQYVQALFRSFDWWRLVPMQDGGVVTSGLGSATDRIYPALASDSSFALIYVPSAQEISIDASRLRPQRVRARLYDPIRGTYTLAIAKAFRNKGSVTISTSGERVIVLDAAR